MHEVGDWRTWKALLSYQILMGSGQGIVKREYIRESSSRGGEVT